MRPPARVWRGEDPEPELTTLVRAWLTRVTPQPRRPRTLLDALPERAPMPKRKPIPEGKPLTEDEKRQDEIQARLVEERRQREGEHGRIDMLGNSTSG